MPILGNRLLKHQAITYLLRDEYTTDASAPLASPRTADPGPGMATIVDTGSDLSISSGELFGDGSGGAGVNDPIVIYQGFSRVAGRVMRTRFRRGSNGSGNSPSVGWANATPNPATTGQYGFNYSTNFAALPAGSDLGSSNAHTTSYDNLDVVLCSTGAYYFINNNLAWFETTGSSATMYPFMASANGANRRNFIADHIRVRDLAGFTDFGWATLNQASPSSGSSYTGNADGIYHLTITAPNPLLGTSAIGTELRYRVQDASNYWTAYLQEDGAFKVDSVSGGVATNRVTVGGVVTNGLTITICVITVGSKHNFYTYAAGSWTKRGSEVNVSHLDTQTTLRPQIGTNWAATNLRSWARSSAAYTVLG